MVTQTPQKVITPKKIKMGFNHIPTYEGDEDPKRHWFVCEKFWDVAEITYEDKQMEQFSVSLRHCDLTWFLNFTENQTRSKSEIKNSFLTFFKVQDVTNLAAQKLKEIKQRPGDSVREYEKRFKDILSQITTTIDHSLLVQWYVVGLLQQIFSPLWLHEITTYDDAL